MISIQKAFGSDGLYTPCAAYFRTVFGLVLRFGALSGLLPRSS